MPTTVPTPGDLTKLRAELVARIAALEAAVKNLDGGTPSTEGT